MINLALVIDNQGKHKEAGEMCRPTLALCEKVLGKEHPTTLLVMKNLALHLSDQGRDDEASTLFKEHARLSELGNTTYTLTTVPETQTLNQDSDV